MRTTIFFVLAFIAVIYAAVHSPTTSPHWHNTLERVHGEQSVKLQFALHQRNLDWLENTILVVSDPRSPSYGKHLNLFQIADKIAPFHFQIQKVLDWLSANGFVFLTLLS